MKSARELYLQYHEYSRLSLILDGISWRMNMGYEVVAIGIKESDYYQLQYSEYYSFLNKPNKLVQHVGFIFGIPVFIISGETTYCIGGIEG